jgi:hypothetical protein
MPYAPGRLALALAATLAALPAATHAAGRFVDGPEAMGARDAVERVADLGLLPGYMGRFHPEKRLTRYRFAVIIGRLLELLDAPPPMVAPPRMPDLREGHWAEVSARRAVAIGAMRAYKDGKFHGDRVVDRYHLAVLYQGVRPLIWPLRTNQILAPKPGDIKRHLWVDAVRLTLGEGYLTLPNMTCFLGHRKVDRLELALFLDKLLPPRFTGGFEQPRDRGVPPGRLPQAVQTVIDIPPIDFGPDRPLLAPLEPPHKKVTLRSVGLSKRSTMGDVEPVLTQVYVDGQQKARDQMQSAYEKRIKENQRITQRRVAESEAVAELRMDEVEFRQRMLDDLEMERQDLYTVERAMETPHGLIVPGRRVPADSWAEGW